MSAAVMALPFVATSCNDDDDDSDRVYDMSSVKSETVSVAYYESTTCHVQPQGAEVILLSVPDDSDSKYLMNYYKFTGWSNSEEAETVDYKPGDTIRVKESLFLYPVFEPVEITKEDVEFTFDILDNTVTLQYITGFPKADYCAWTIEDVDGVLEPVEDEGAKASFDLDFGKKYKVTLYAEVEEDNAIEVDTIVDLTNMLTPDFEVKLVQTVDGTDNIVVEQNVEGAETVIWNFGAKGSYTINNGDKDFNKLSHTYVKSGTYTITLTVVDKQGRKTSAVKKYTTAF